MSVRVIARIRPLLKTETEKDVLLEAPQDRDGSRAIIKIPNPKCQSEYYSFQFNSVYDRDATQAQIFDDEVSPNVKHLFKGYDVTLFAYGVTGTGKTHTMRGGKSLADRGVIPRLLSSIYRRARKIEKDTEGDTQVQVVMSYYEIYNDKVFDLFEPPEKRTMAGLPIRDNNGKTVVVGLTERPCTTLKEFENLYDEANVNRSTSATKLNAHSSRSHAILCVKVTQTTGTETRISTASAIDLAGSEDNRRTDNNKDRLVESASINKSLFALAQCVEAISKRQSRIPYRESKMTRILSLGQNDGITVMILNLAPVRSYHLDTLSSLNFANRTKKIEVREVENQPFFREQPVKNKLEGAVCSSYEAPSMHRQPLRPKMLSQHSNLKGINVTKPAKQFSVYTDKGRPSTTTNLAGNARQSTFSSQPAKSPKRTSSEAFPALGKPSKFSKLTESNSHVKVSHPALSKDAIEAMIDRKVSEALAERGDQTTVSNSEPVSEDVQKRLEALEKRIEGQESERAEGLQYLLMAKQHHVRGEEGSALRMYQLALPYFPGNEKLARKVEKLRNLIAMKKTATQSLFQEARAVSAVERKSIEREGLKRKPRRDDDDSYHEIQDEGQPYEEEDEFVYRPRTKIRRPQKPTVNGPVNILNGFRKTALESSIGHPPLYNDDSEDELASASMAQTPRTKQLLDIINSRDVKRLTLLKGVGAKRAEAIVNCLCDVVWDAPISSLGEIGKLSGVGMKTVETMRNGIVL